MPNETQDKPKEDELEKLLKAIEEQGLKIEVRQLARLWGRLSLSSVSFLIIILLAAGSLIALGKGVYDGWRTPATPSTDHNPPQQKTPASNVQIESSEALGPSSPHQLKFMGAHWHLLDRDRPKDKSNFRAFVVKSTSIPSPGHQRFYWSIRTKPHQQDLVSNLGAAYLQRKVGTRYFYESLVFEADKERINVPETEGEDRIIVLLSLSGNREIPSDVREGMFDLECVQ